MELTKYTQDDFFTCSPYEEIMKYSDDPFSHERAITQMANYAKSVGIHNFKKLYGEYTKSLKRAASEIYIRNSTNFTGQPLELDAGDWEADDFGVTRTGGMMKEVACPHPILPVERLVNIDTGVEKLKIAFRKGKRWRELIADKKTLASKNSIVALADLGIAVTSENASYLVKYISDIENINYEQIPEKKCVSRLGYISGEGFSPYVEGLVFDGDLNFKPTFNCIRPFGKKEEWLNVAKEIRSSNISARIVLASAFASTLIEPLGINSFFVHLWGGESGTGKTVALMLAASVWGNPEVGKYIQTFNSTVVGRERLAAFLNHLPLCVDELQLAKNAYGKTMFDVYQLAEGAGKIRGTKNGGVEQTPTWANTIITTGETPMTNSGSGAGAINRVIEIECKTSEKIIEDGHKVSSTVKKNYGFAGKEFVEKLYSGNNVEKACKLYVEYFKKLTDGDTTDKQAMAAAAILVADKYATEWIFMDNYSLTIEDISKFLASKIAVSAGERGYRYMLDWTAQNSNKLRPDNEGEVYGVIENDLAYIIRPVFNRAAEDAGFSANALLSYLKDRNLIVVREKGFTKAKRINGAPSECVVLKLTQDDEENDDFDDLDLPF